MNLSFTEEYFPDLESITPAALTKAREMVVRILQPSMPDVDLSPGTPTGDLVVSVLGAFWASADEANSRLMSDLDLENVSNGIIYSCAFVKAYLGNFAVYDVENLRTTGLVRLTFKSPDARTMPLAVRFRFGNSDDYHLFVADSGSESIRILGAGSAHDNKADTYALSQTSSNTWAVDLPVTGSMTAAVARGTAGMATVIEPDLVGIASAITFLPGLPSASLRDLAKLARKTAFSLTSGSRASTRSLVLRNWPETVMVSPIVTGDDEMQRAPVGSAMLMQRPAIDVYVRSSRDMQRDSQIVRLEYVTLPSGEKIFRGALNLLHIPSRLISVEWSGALAESPVDNYTIFTKTSRPDLYGSMHCGSRYERLYLEVIPKDLTSATPIVRSEELVGGVMVTYAMFVVTYDSDPLVATMASTLEAPDNIPPGVSVVVKSGPLISVDDLTIKYSKKKGVRTTLNVAREKIRDYFLASGYPDVFRQTVIHDIMVDAGVELVTDISCSGRITPSAAKYRINIPNPIDSVSIASDWTTNSTEIAPININSIADMHAAHIINEDVGDQLEVWAATARTVRYVADVENINFIEIQ